MIFPIAALKAAVLLQCTGAQGVLSQVEGGGDFGSNPEHRIESELGPLLSAEAAISVPSSPGWDQLVLQASAPRIHPGFLASVKVATEEDVQETASNPLS